MGGLAFSFGRHRPGDAQLFGVIAGPVGGEPKVVDIAQLPFRRARSSR